MSRSLSRENDHVAFTCTARKKHVPRSVLVCSTTVCSTRKVLMETLGPAAEKRYETTFELFSVQVYCMCTVCVCVCVCVCTYNSQYEYTDIHTALFCTRYHLLEYFRSSAE